MRKASSTVSSGAHTINVATGTYAERVTDSYSGSSAGNYRWWKANGSVNMGGFYITGSYIKITGFTIETSTTGYDGVGIRAQPTNYSVFDGNTIQDCPNRGIFIWMGSHNTVSNNTVVRCAEAGLDINGDYNLIENNDISDIRNCVKGLCQNSGQADGIRPFGGYNTYRGNYIHNMHYASQTYVGEPPHMDGFQTWNAPNCPVIHDTVFERNHVIMNDVAVHPNTAMHGFMFNGGAYNLTFKNNIFEVHNFMNASNTGPGDPKVYNLYFYNNTLRGSLSHWVSNGDPYGSCGFLFTNVTGTVEIKNNITVDFEGHYSKESSCDAVFTRKNNVIWNSNSTTPGITGFSPTYDPTDLWKIDPKFVTQWTNLQLQGSSPCIDAGIKIDTVTNDYLGAGRPYGSGYDVGAYEHAEETPLSPPSGLRIVN